MCVCCILVWQPLKHSRLLARDYNGQFCCYISLSMITIYLPCFLKLQWPKLSYNFCLCSQMNDTTRNPFWDKIWIVWFGYNFSVTVIICSFCFVFLIHLLHFGKLMHHFLSQTKLSTALKWPALGRSIKMLTQCLIPHRQVGSTDPHGMMTAVSYILLLTTEKWGEKWSMSQGNWSTTLETLIQKHLPKLMVRDLIFTHERKHMWRICIYSLPTFFIIYFRLWYLYIPVSQLKINFGRS